MAQVKRALISVYNKEGILPFAKTLHSFGIEIISTGGTAELLKKSGVPVKEVSSVTQFPEMLDGRVKTLHPRLHAGILAVRDNPEHVKTLKEHAIEPIDLIVVNLYPFWDAVKTKTREEDIIEMIDIGGPSMLRGAAKNFHYVAAVSDPADYKKISVELEANEGALSEATRRYLAGKVFKLTAYYDGLVSAYFARHGGIEGAFPERLSLSFEKVQDLRYGENPHQKGTLYADPGGEKDSAVTAEKLNGKELSFNNFLDLDAALEMAEAFEGTACSIVKHTSPCGFALGRDAAGAFKAAHACDPLSAFGGIVAFNCPVDERTAKAILAAGFLECVIARAFTSGALGLLRTKKNLRLLATNKKEAGSHDGRPQLDFKQIRGGLLLQDRDTRDVSEAELKTVTKIKPKRSEIKDLLFAFKVSRFVKSNAIVIAKNGITLGMGMGQPSRVDACHTAFKKAGKRSHGAVLASDGFFPKPDSIALARKFGIRAIIQPGGSIQDEEVINACDKARIAMVFTGVRHFKH